MSSRSPWVAGPTRGRRAGGALGDLLLLEGAGDAHEAHEHGLAVLLLVEGGQHLPGGVAGREQGCGDRPGRGPEQAVGPVSPRLELRDGAHEDDALGAATLEDEIEIHACLL